MDNQMVDHMVKYHRVMDPRSRELCCDFIKRSLKADAFLFALCDGYDTLLDLRNEVLRNIETSLAALRLGQYDGVTTQ